MPESPRVNCSKESCTRGRMDKYTDTNPQIEATASVEIDAEITIF
jgi:hypothetical protein